MFLSQSLYPALLLLGVCVVMELDHDVVVPLLAHASHDSVHHRPDVGVDLGHTSYVTIKPPLSLCPDLLVTSLTQL